MSDQGWRNGHADVEEDLTYAVGGSYTELSRNDQKAWNQVPRKETLWT